MDKAVIEEKLSIIMPAYNEEALIYNSIAETAHAVELFGGHTRLSWWTMAALTALPRKPSARLKIILT